MKESNILAGNATNNFLSRENLVNTKRQCMKDSNFLADNADINLHQREILLNTKEQYMKESNTLAENAAINLLQREILLNTKETFNAKKSKDIIFSCEASLTTFNLTDSQAGRLTRQLA